MSVTRLTMHMAVAFDYKRGKGTDSYATNLRNISIIRAVDRVSTNFDLNPTRSSATADEVESGSSIVAEACRRRGMRLTEAAVAKIWQKRSRLEGYTEVRR